MTKELLLQGDQSHRLLLLSSLLLSLLGLISLLLSLSISVGLVILVLLLVVGLILVGLVLVGLVEGSLLLLGELVVDGVVGTVLLGLLEILELGLPDTAESRGRVLGDLRPGGLSAEELHVVGLGRESEVACVGLASKATDVVEVVVVAAEDVRCDESLGVEDWSVC